MMATTIINSMSVKPFWRLVRMRGGSWEVHKGRD